MQRFPFRVIDLTHPIQPGMPVWPGDPETERVQHSTQDAHGYSLNQWTFGEHSGTHVGAPSHRVPGGRSLDQVDVNDLILALRVIAATEPVSVLHLERHEVEHGRIEPDSCIALCTGWSERWPNAEAVFERDDQGAFQWPGFTVEAVEWLHRERQVKMLATDAPDIGYGADTDLDVGKRCAELDMLHVENLANLDQVPVNGGYLVIGALPLVGGTGSPARVFGLIP